MSLLYSAVRNNQDRFIQAQQVMYIAAVGVLFLSLVQTLTGIIQGLGKPRVPVYFLALGGIVKVVSMLVLMQFTRHGRSSGLHCPPCSAMRLQELPILFT